MSETATISGLRADPSMRWAQTAAAPMLSEHLDRAAHEVARLGSPLYDEMSRFAGRGVRVIQAGLARTAPAERQVGDGADALAAPKPDGASDLYRKFTGHLATLHRSARDGIREGMARADRFARDNAPPAPDAAPRSRDSLLVAAIHNAAAITAFARAARQKAAPKLAQLRTTVPAEAGRLRRWASGLALGAVMLTAMTAGVAIERAGQIARFFSHTALAVQVGATERLRSVAQHRYAAAGGIVAGVAGLAALGVGMHMPDILHGASTLQAHLPDPATVVHSVARATQSAFETHDQMATLTVDAARSLAERATRAGATYYHQLASILGQSAPGDDIIRIAGSEHVRNAASAYSQHIQTVTQHATPAGTLAGHIGHAIPATEHAHAAAVRPVAAHAPLHHADVHHAGGIRHAAPSAAMSSGAAQFGDHTADAYNGPELVKIQMANGGGLHAAASHAVPTAASATAAPAGVPGHAAVSNAPAFGDHTADAYNGPELVRIHLQDAGHANAVHAGASLAPASTGTGTAATAPVVPVHAEALAAPAASTHPAVVTAAAAPAHPAAASSSQSISQMASHVVASITHTFSDFPSMPSIDIAGAFRSLDPSTPSTPAVR